MKGSSVVWGDPRVEEAPRAAEPTRLRVARATAIGLWLVLLGLVLFEIWMIAATLERPAPDQWGFRGFEAAFALSFGSVGALIATRRPDNRIGWVALVFALVGAVMGVVDQYPILAQAAQPPLPYGAEARWVSSWIWVIGMTGLGAVLPFYFPDGRLLSPRWRWGVIVSVVAMAVLIGSIIASVQPIGPLAPSPRLALLGSDLPPLIMLGFAVYLAGAGLAAVSLVQRYRHATGEVRQQIKWVAYAGVLVAVGVPIGSSTLFVGQLFLVATGLFAALAILIAVSRYRLYQIDQIINRTVVFGALSAILAGVYTASITLSQRLFVAVTGERSDAAIVLTTLIVAATFTPMKTRLQAAVDARMKPAGPRGLASVPSAFTGPAEDRIVALELLARMAELRDAGTVSPDEFEGAKARLLEEALG